MADVERHEGMDDIHLGESRVEERYTDNKILNEEARQATATEHSLSFWQAIKTYKKAAIWSIREYRVCQERREFVLTLDRQ